MTTSIYHFFQLLERQKALFLTVEKLEDFPFDESVLSCQSKGKFPDLAVKINSGDPMFRGGELIELKDSKSYQVSSFNSTIPTGQKSIAKIVGNKRSSIKEQMEASGDDVFSLSIRDVYYLIRGRKKQSKHNKLFTKVALVHGSFFETISEAELISQSFAQVLDERLSDTGLNVTQSVRDLLTEVFSDHDSFSKVRNVEAASVKLRFRIMTEVRKEGNILNSKIYPEILDDTINLVVLAPNQEVRDRNLQRFCAVYEPQEVRSFNIFSMKHPLNGAFLVFQKSMV